MRLYDSENVKAVIELPAVKEGKNIKIKVEFEFARLTRLEMADFTKKETSNNFFDIDIVEKVKGFKAFKDVFDEEVSFTDENIRALLNDAKAFSAIYIGMISANIDGSKKT